MAMAGNIEDIRKYPTYALVCRRYAPFETFGVAFPYGLGRFEGDNRGPSTSLKDSSRIYQVIFFNRYGLVYDYAGTSGTAYNSAVWGKIVGHAKISSTVVRGTLSGPDLFGFEASNAGGNPLVKPAPDINTLLRARIDFGLPGKLRVQCDVFGDNFPNLEVFLTSPKSDLTALLIDGRTTGGRNFGPQTRLWGESRNHRLAGCNTAISLRPDDSFAQSYTVGPTPLP
jgi:hypothetical protein